MGRQNLTERAVVRVLVWFRSDLRLADNPALVHACRAASRGVVAVFVICPDQWKRHNDAPIKVDFWLRNLREISSALAAKNIALKIVVSQTFAGVPEVLADLAETLGCDGLYFNREYEVNERERDGATAEHFESIGKSVRTFYDQSVFEPGELRTGKGSYYTIFTPFKRAWYKAFVEDPARLLPLPAPRKLPEMVSDPDEIPGVMQEITAPVDTVNQWPAGERAAQHLLRQFVQNRISSYNETRDFPAKGGTSSLSPYLASGVISIRQCCHAAVEANDGNADTGCEGAVCWISELVWREFYKHLLIGFSRLSRHRAFKLDTERITWNDDGKLHDAWCQGRTGVPIVDAAMRQLLQTGWMHNRLRMVSAMFYTKNLFLDWRRGERFFMQNLIDGDLSANNGGWQWSASTGTDAAPYFRIFNPYSQSMKFDPTGEFIRKYVPELGGLNGKDVHDPSQISALLRSRVAYPNPIVNCAATRRAAIEAFKAL
jgi:deoxyribodipyrimidine photo-lyase